MRVSSGFPIAMSRSRRRRSSVASVLLLVVVAAVVVARLPPSVRAFFTPQGCGSSGFRPQTRLRPLYSSPDEIDPELVLSELRSLRPEIFEEKEEVEQDLRLADMVEKMRAEVRELAGEGGADEDDDDGDNFMLSSVWDPPDDFVDDGRLDVLLNKVAEYQSQMEEQGVGETEDGSENRRNEDLHALGRPLLVQPNEQPTKAEDPGLLPGEIPLFPESYKGSQIESKAIEGLEMGQPPEICGIWQLYSTAIMGEDGPELADPDSQEIDPADRIVLRIDGYVVGGPVVREFNEELEPWGDPAGQRAFGGQWYVYSDQSGRSRLHVALYGDRQKSHGLTLDGALLMINEYDHQTRSMKPLPRVLGEVSEVARRPSKKHAGKDTMQQRKRGDFSMVKLNTEGMKLEFSIGSNRPRRLW
jgi:hypothetical protein